MPHRLRYLLIEEKKDMIIRNDASRTKWPRLRSASEFKFMRGEEENAALPHFPPLPT